MKTVASWSDLEPFGILILTGEACGLMYRVLFDLTEQGKKVVEKCLGCAITAEPWNGGLKDDPHVASIMLTHEMLMPLGVFALLEGGCSEVWKAESALYGIEASDTQEYLESLQRHHGLMRRFAYRGTAGDRNVHMMSGRVT